MRGGGGHFLYSDYVIIKEYLTAMIAYGLGVLLIIRELQEAHPKVTQPCYADNMGAVWTFTCILTHVDNIMVQGPQGDIF